MVSLATKSRSRESALQLPPNNPFVPVDSRDKVVDVVSSYIQSRKACREFAWADLLSTQLEKFKKLRYSLRLDLFLSATDYFAEGSDGDISSTSSSTGTRAFGIQNYADLFQYLETERGSNGRAQILSFVHGNEITMRLEHSDVWYHEARAAIALSFPARESGGQASGEKLFRITSAILCAIIGHYWQINTVHLTQLFNFGNDDPRVRRKLREKPVPSRSFAHTGDVHTHLAQVPILDDPIIYQNDNQVYTARPHCTFPKKNTINVFCSFERNSKRYRMLAACSFQSEIEQKPTDIRDLCNLSDPENCELITLCPGYALAALERKALRTHGIVLEDFGYALQNLKYLSRPSPTIAKLEWLLYVTDCVETIVQATKRLGRHPSAWPSSSDTRSDEWWQAFEEERSDVLTKADELLNEVERVKRTIREIMDVGAGARQTLLMVLAAIYVPLSFTTGIFGMNLSEINASTPHYYHVLLIGIPLALLTALLPLYFNPLWRFSYRTLPLLRQALATPSSDRILMGINFVFFAATVTLCGTSSLFRWGPTAGFVAWSSFVCFVAWVRRSRLFWVHWFASMLVLLVLVLLAIWDQGVWSLLPILCYWVLRDWLSLKAFWGAARRSFASPGS